MNYTVYMHITPNNKKYIGITKNKVKERWKNGRGYERQLFYNAILKYGWDNIQHIILYQNLTREEAEQKEIELIKRYNTRNRKYGYNLDGGGNVNREVSEETREKISLKKRGVKHSPESIEKQRMKVLGKKWSEETREKIMKSRRLHKKVLTLEQRKAISERVSGKNHPMYGKHHSLETRQKMSNTRKGEKKQPMTDITKQKLREIRIIKRPILQYDLNMSFIKKYESSYAIKEELGYDNIPINRCAKGRQKTSYGYIWKFEGDLLCVNNIL